jgi:hypothetical protein
MGMLSELFIWVAVSVSMWSAVVCVVEPAPRHTHTPSPGPARLALGGYDVIECANQQLQFQKSSHNNDNSAAAAADVNCTATGSYQWSTELDSVDREGNLLFASTFFFASEDNMIAFENAPVAFAPQFGGMHMCTCVCVRMHLLIS